jgi:hypothetical protein
MTDSATYHFPIYDMLLLSANLLGTLLKLKDNKPKPSTLVRLSVEHYFRTHHTTKALEVRSKLS